MNCADGYLEICGISWVVLQMTHVLVLHWSFGKCYIQTVTLRWGSGFNSLRCTDAAVDPTLPQGNFHIQFCIVAMESQLFENFSLKLTCFSSHNRWASKWLKVLTGFYVKDVKRLQHCTMLFFLKNLFFLKYVNEVILKWTALIFIITSISEYNLDNKSFWGSALSFLKG